MNIGDKNQSWSMWVECLFYLNHSLGKIYFTTFRIVNFFFFNIFIRYVRNIVCFLELSYRIFVEQIWFPFSLDRLYCSIDSWAISFPSFSPKLIPHLFEYVFNFIIFTIPQRDIFYIPVDVGASHIWVIIPFADEVKLNLRIGWHEFLKVIGCD